MEKLDKKKILAVVLIIALIAAFAGAVALLYNAIDMFLNTTFYSDYYGTPYLFECFDYFQKPLAIITLIASLVALSGVASGIAAFIVKKPTLKKVSLAISVVAVVSFIVFIIAANCVWTNSYKEYLAEKWHLIPAYVSYNSTAAQMYALYSGVMTALLPALVYFTVIAAAIVVVYIIDKKSAKASAEQAAEIPDEQEQNSDKE